MDYHRETSESHPHRLIELQAYGYIVVRSLKAHRGERTTHPMTDTTVSAMPMETYADCFVTLIRSLQKVVVSSML